MEQNNQQISQEAGKQNPGWAETSQAMAYIAFRIHSQVATMFHMFKKKRKIQEHLDKDKEDINKPQKSYLETKERANQSSST